MPDGQLQIGKSECAGRRLLRPVKDCQDGLTLVFAQEKNTRLLILIGVSEEIQRQSSPPKFCHGKQIRIPDQGHAFWITPEGWEVVANFEHSSRNRRQRDRNLRLVQCKRSLNGSLFKKLPGNRERVRVSDEKVAMHVITRRDAWRGFLAAEKGMTRILGYTAFID